MHEKYNIWMRGWKYLMARSNASGKVFEMHISKSISTVASLNEPKSIFSNALLEEAKKTL
jgi:hypothetical protein